MTKLTDITDFKKILAAVDGLRHDHENVHVNWDNQERRTSFAHNSVINALVYVLENQWDTICDQVKEALVMDFYCEILTTRDQVARSIEWLKENQHIVGNELPDKRQRTLDLPDPEKDETDERDSSDPD